VTSAIAFALAAGLLMLVAIVALMTRRVRAHNHFELGSVSQQWLVGHKDEG